MIYEPYERGDLIEFQRPVRYWSVDVKTFVIRYFPARGRVLQVKYDSQTVDVRHMSGTRHEMLLSSIRKVLPPATTRSKP